MTQIQLIDAVLYLLAKDILLKPLARDVDIFAALLKLHPELKEQMFAGADLLTVLDKLVDDKNIKRKNRKVSDGGNLPTFHIEIQYSITFGGSIFYMEGGYAKKKRRETISTNLQSWQTWAIAVGTVFAALGTIGLLCFEYLKYNKTYPFGIHSLHKIFFVFCFVLFAMVAVRWKVKAYLLKHHNKN